MEPTSSPVSADFILADFQRVISRYVQNISTYFLWFVFLEIRLVNINSDSLSFFSLCSFQQRMLCLRRFFISKHHNDVTIGAMASQLTSLTTIYSTVYSGADQGKHQSSASLAFVRGIHRWPVNSPHKGPVTQKMFPFHDVIMGNTIIWIVPETIPVVTCGQLRWATACKPTQMRKFAVNAYNILGAFVALVDTTHIYTVV